MEKGEVTREDLERLERKVDMLVSALDRYEKLAGQWMLGPGQKVIKKLFRLGWL